jgi:histidyl-tRNA synthetase
MKHILSDLDMVEQKKVMAALDKRDMNHLQTTLTEINHIELCEPLIRLMTASTLDEVWEITGDIPERVRIEEIFRYLTIQNIPFVQNFGIARGLDYYVGMVFEGFADNLGAENQILGGGVYQLTHLLGGKDVPSCGFAIGFDRVMVSLGDISPKTKPIVAIIATPATRASAYTAATAFRAEGITVVMDVMDRTFGTQFASALKSGASYAVFINEKEAAAGTITLKNLAETTQREMSLADAVDEVVNGSC